MIGVDLVKIDRFKEINEDDFKVWDKFFNLDEWAYSFSKGNSHEHLAAIFSAKESVMKAVGGDLIGRFDLIKIKHNKDGRPVALISGKNNRKVEISISHDSGFVVSVAVLL